MDAMMDGAMMDGGVIFEEPTTGHAESTASNAEMGQLLLTFCRDVREGQNRLSAQLQAVHNNVSTLLQHVSNDSPVHTLRASIPKRSWQSKKSTTSIRSDHLQRSESSQSEMKATATEPHGKIEIPNFPRQKRVSLLSHLPDQAPNTSKSLSSFRQIDACVDGNILRRGFTRKVFESCSLSFSSKQSPGPSRNNSLVPFGRPDASISSVVKVGVEPQSPSKQGLDFTDFTDLKSSRVEPDSEMSMAALFKTKATELMPKSKTGTTCSPITTEPSEAPATMLSRCCLLMISISLRLMGMLPWASFSPFLVGDEEYPGPCQRQISKFYRWFIILLNVASLACSLLTGWGHEGIQVALATSASISLGAAVLCFSGPLRSNETQEEQGALMSYLENFMYSGGLSERWRWQQMKAAMRVATLWCCVVGFKAWLAYRHSMNSELWQDVLEVGTYGVSAGCLLAALYLQSITWNGINMMIFSFAQRVLRGDWESHDCRRNWREAVSLMRVTSRVYQRSFASLAGTTLMVFFASLFDIHQQQALETLPSLVLAIAVMVAPFMAASATAHCTRLPSLVSMIDGDEEQEAHTLDLANFLTLCESGFFMWDTRVSLGVMQKFVYFSVAIVSTIGFQLGVFHF